MLQQITATRVALVIGIALLGGCATAPVSEPAAPGPDQEVQIETEADIQELLARAARSAPPLSVELTLMAAERALEQGRVDQASAILARADTQKWPALTRRALFLQAEILINEGEPARALAVLKAPALTGANLTRDDQVRIGNIRSRAWYAGRSYLASARELIFIHDLLDEQEKQRNHEQIFATLMELPATTLFNQAERAITSDIRGWLSLAAVTKQNQSDPLKQLIAVNRWKQAWPHHPAASMMPASLQLLSKVVDERPNAIALLLPLSGDLGAYGRAIRDGFLAAHYDTDEPPVVRIYDTNTAPVDILLQQAAIEGAELAVGPLERQRVTELTGQARLPVPVLALNRSFEGRVHPDVYQFGLAPEDEVVQVAQQAWEEGKRNALVLFADTDWGYRNYETFQQAWQELGGNIVDSAAFQNRPDYSDLVKGLLNVDESETRVAELRRILGQRFEYKPRRRQDVDFVLLLADAAQARRLNPTLAFFYAEDLPVYATSTVHAHADSKIEAIDLNGIRFCDMPWKLAVTDNLQRRVEQTWPEAGASMAAFYALGVDAYRLYPRLQQLKQIPESRLYGATGVLRLNEANVVTRQLLWARFIDGEAVASPIVMEVSSR